MGPRHGPAPGRVGCRRGGAQHPRVLFFVLCMCSMLVLLYFFFNQLVYVIMAMFCIASTLAMYSCLEPIVMASYSLASLPVLRLPRVNLYLCVLQLELRQFLLL